LPLVGLFIVSLLALTAVAVRQTVRDIHLESAGRRVAEIAGEIERRQPNEWSGLLAATADAGQREKVVAALEEAVFERGLERLKLYEATGKALFSTERSEIGAIENNAALSSALAGEPVLLPHREPDGTQYNEFYIPLHGSTGSTALAFELYEPAGYLGAILARALVLPILAPGLLLVGLILFLGYLIRQAQAGIDLRAARVRELSMRLESFMSSSAVGAVRDTPAGGDVPLRRIEVSLLHSDVRSFTGFSETVSPEEVVSFLNRIMTLQIECVARHGGDVDKLIGDALLARFEGASKEGRAIAAARDIQAAVEQSALPRGVGVGIFTGPAILGPIGPEARRDYTVIGDSVNIAARLCAEARPGEIVADTATLDRSGAASFFGPAERVRVKGREHLVEIRRVGGDSVLSSR
jgi:class 3 adenylate cyclase